MEDYRNNKITIPENQTKSNFKLQINEVSINLIKLGSAASIRDQHNPTINFCFSLINKANKKIRKPNSTTGIFHQQEFPRN